MAQAYSPGLSVTDNIILRKERILPLKGTVLVKKGDKVKAEDLVAETSLPGKVLPLNLANKLGVTPAMINEFIKVAPGQQIEKNQILAENKGLFGLGFMKNSVKSPIEGEVESISKLTGQILLREPRIPVQVKAFIDGVITKVIENEGVEIENKSAYIQGIFGIGGETLGIIHVLANSPESEITIDMLSDANKGQIIVSGKMCSYDVIQKARQVGVHAIITGGIDDQELKKLLGYDIGVAITGHENLGITILVTEGFGPINMAKKTYELLKKFDGSKASIHGKTQIRAGVMRPELIIPLPFDENELVVKEAAMPTLDNGTLIRVIRQPGFGKIGRVTGLPELLTVVESETKVRVLEAKLEDGTTITIPRANVEVIEE